MFNDNTVDDDDSYFLSASFFARFILLLMLLAAWISAAVALDSSSLSASGLSSTRTAFLIIAVLSFVESLTIIILSLVDVINDIVYLVLDIIFGLMLLAVSIAAIVRDNQVNNNTLSGSQYRYGSLAAAAVFGFISFVLYVMLVIFYIVGI